MRTRATILTLAILLILPATAAGQPQGAAPRLFGTFDAGFRTSDIDGDAARFQRFPDTREQGVGVRFRIDREGPDWAVTARGTNVGYLDQQWQAAGATGRLTVSFDWRQTRRRPLQGGVQAARVGGGVPGLPRSRHRERQGRRQTGLRPVPQAALGPPVLTQSSVHRLIGSSAHRCAGGPISAPPPSPLQSSG